MGNGGGGLCGMGIELCRRTQMIELQWHAPQEAQMLVCLLGQGRGGGGGC